MKILELLYTNGIAGAEKYLQHLLPAIKRKGIDCHLIVVCSHKAEKILTTYVEEFRLEGVPATLIVTRRAGFMKVAWKINNYLKQHELSIVHSHLLYSDLIATLVKTFFKPSLVIVSTKHGYNEEILKKLTYSTDATVVKKLVSKDIHYYTTCAILKKIDYNFAVSNALSLLYYNLGLLNYKMPYIYHGVSLDIKFENLQYRIAEKQIICVGRLEEIKGQRYLIEAMPAIVKQLPDAKLIFIGRGSEEKNLKQLSADLQMDKNIVFMGFNNNPYPYLSNSDVAIIPSLFEAFGLVYIEAFALKAPIVAFDIAAGNEIIEKNKTGLLVPSKDVQQLAEKILYLLQNPGKAKEIGDAAYQLYLNHFTTARMVTETVSYYHTVFENIKKRKIS